MFRSKYYKFIFCENVYIVAVHSLMSGTSLSSACVNSFGFAENGLILCVPLCDCNNPARISKLEAPHIA